MSQITESEIERLALELLQEQGFELLAGPETGPDARAKTGPGAVPETTAPAGENDWRESYSEVLLKNSLRSAVDRLNPDLPASAREDALTAHIV